MDVEREEDHVGGSTEGLVEACRSEMRHCERGEQVLKKNGE